MILNEVRKNKKTLKSEEITKLLDEMDYLRDKIRELS